MRSDTVSALEITWSTIALLGTVTAATLLVNVWLSYRTVLSWIDEDRAVRWGPRHRFALGFLIGGLLLLVVWLGFVALGANALLSPPAPDPVRQASADRGGWILTCLATVLLAFQAVLVWAWLSLARPSLGPALLGTASPSELLFRVIDLGREMGHLVANDLVRPVTVLDEIARDEQTPAELRAEAAVAIADLETVMRRVKAIHETIKRQEPEP